MKSLNYIIVAIFLFLLSMGEAQNLKPACINLKNGSIIHGKVIENIPDSLIKVQTEGNSIWVFKYSEIDTILFSKNVKTESAGPVNIELQPGFNGIGKNQFNPSFSFLISATYNFKERFNIGLTSGVEYFGIPLLPVAVEFRADIFKRNVSPFIYMRGGYDFKLLPDEHTEDYDLSYTGGKMFGFGIGIKKRFSSEFALNFSIGYARRETFEIRDYTVEDIWTSDYKRHYFYNRTALIIGFMF